MTETYTSFMTPCSPTHSTYPLRVSFFVIRDHRFQVIIHHGNTLHVWLPFDLKVHIGLLYWMDLWDSGFDCQGRRDRKKIKGASSDLFNIYRPWFHIKLAHTINYKLKRSQLTAVCDSDVFGGHSFASSPNNNVDGFSQNGFYDSRTTTSSIATLCKITTSIPVS